MRKVALQMEQSLDGYSWGESGEPDAGLAKWVAECLHRAGTHIMGGVTYREMAAHWPYASGDIAAAMNDIPKVVFAGSLDSADWPDTRIARGDLAAELAGLRDEPGGDIVAHGGARFARSLSRLGLVDEYRLVVHPVVLGRGLRLFPQLPGGALQLRLVDAVRFDSGAVAHVFRPRVAGAAAAGRSAAAAT
jgi:dihydrofolate reductase